MIIDGHTHLGKRAYGTISRRFEISVTAEHLINVMDKNRIDKAVVTSLTSSSKHNRYVQKVIKEYSNRLIGFYWANPRYSRIKRDLEEALRDHEFKGVKLRPESDDFRIHKLSVVGPIMEVTEEWSVPVFIHSSSRDLRSTPSAIARIAELFPKVTIILGHMGGESRVSIDIAKRSPNILIDSSTVRNPRSISEAVRILGPKRIVFGSDFPYMRQSVERAKIEKLRGRDKWLILGDNIAKILKIDAEG